MKTTVKKVLAVMLVVATLLSLCSCSVGKKNVDFRDYITIEFNGYNGFASVVFDCDLSELDEEIDSEKFEKKFQKFIEKLDNADSLEASWILSSVSGCEDFFEVELAEESTTLSNGDIVTVNITVSDAMEYLGATMKDVEDLLGIKIKETTLEYTVEGLEDAKLFDITPYVKDLFSFSGEVSGEIRAEYNIPNDFSVQIDDFYVAKGDYVNTLNIVKDNKKLGYISLEMEGANGSCVSRDCYSNGDKFNVEIYDASDLKDYGYVVVTGMVEVTVPNFPEYFSSKEQFTEERKATIKAEFENFMKTNYGGYVCEIYIGTIKPTSTRAEKYIVCAVVYDDGMFGGYRKVHGTPILDQNDNVIIELSKAGFSYDSPEEVYDEVFDHDNYTFEKF